VVDIFSFIEFNFDFPFFDELSTFRLLGNSISVAVVGVESNPLGGNLIFSFKVGVETGCSSSVDNSRLSLILSFKVSATFGVGFAVRFAVVGPDTVGVADFSFSSALKSVSKSEEASSASLKLSFEETSSSSLDELNRGRAVPAVTPRPVMDVWYFGFGPRRAAVGAGVDSAKGLPATLLPVTSSSVSESLRSNTKSCYVE